MAIKKDSVAKGGGSVAVARLLGMVLSFLLFMVLARHSSADAGVFRTVATYLIIAEYLGMLGMHRWLSTEITANKNREWSIFLATNVVMLIATVILIAVYLIIAACDFYSADINHGLVLATLSLIPSSIYQCVQSALVGIGKTYSVGKFNAMEYITRCSLAILLVYYNYPVTDVIWVFVLTRWGVAIYGFYQLTHTLKANTWYPSKTDIAHVMKDAPKFLLIIGAFLLLRNAALVLIPALINDSEVAFYGVAYQLFDMILIIPSVLAISSNHVFVNKAEKSIASLKRVSTQLVSVTSIAMFPCIAITAAFSHNFLLFLYGTKYIIAKHALMLLMLASGLAMIDQVLSQIMTSRKDYKNDMKSILVGGISAAVLTYLMVLQAGATGAAMAFMLASLLTVITRLTLLHSTFPIQLLLTSIWRPALSAFIIFIVSFLCLKLPAFNVFAESRYWWIACVPLLLGLYALLLYLLGGLSNAKIRRIHHFLFHH